MKREHHPVAKLRFQVFQEVNKSDYPMYSDRHLVEAAISYVLGVRHQRPIDFTKIKLDWYAKGQLNIVVTTIRNFKGLNLSEEQSKCLDHLGELV